jgi:nucleoside-diphosphate-sugar epimerase
MAGRIKRVLVTGASGQLGAALVGRLVEEGMQVRALVHRSPLNVKGIDMVRGDVSDLAAMQRAVQGVDAVCHLATTKEDPATFIDVSIRGAYNLLEAARAAGTVKRWILAGGDAAMGIYYYPQPRPITETMPHRAYPGVYALSKVMEEVLGRQFFIQHRVPYVCLRASWVLHEDMILRHFSARTWQKRLTPAQQRRLQTSDAVAMLVRPGGRPLLRHVVALEDVVNAFLLALRAPEKRVLGQTFNISGPLPFRYDKAAACLARKINLPVMPVKVPEAHDFRISIARARRVLGYSPQGDIRRIIDDALAWRARGG